MGRGVPLNGLGSGAPLPTFCIKGKKPSDKASLRNSPQRHLQQFSKFPSTIKGSDYLTPNHTLIVTHCMLVSNCPVIIAARHNRKFRMKKKIHPNKTKLIPVDHS